ncbi:hypothetical protein [Nonomuraea recticatena]|uniref:hypothetical protein n=1 Tax=Nonomuraea recticatena TaxID=46178 RepID=UPI0036216E7F
MTDRVPPTSAILARILAMPLRSCGTANPPPSSLTVSRSPLAPTVTAMDTVPALLCRSTLSSASSTTAMTLPAIVGGTSLRGSAQTSTAIPVRCDHSARWLSRASAKLCPHACASHPPTWHSPS